MSKEDLARQYYQDLIGLENNKEDLAKRLSKKAKEIGKDKFIREYPLSLLDIISYRTFWEVCYDLEIVENPFYCEEERKSSFERKLHNIITSLIYLKNESSYSKEDIINLFNKYKYSS